MKAWFTFSIVIWVLQQGCGSPQSGNEVADPEMRIVIGTDPSYPLYLQVIFENSVFKAVFRVNEGGVAGFEHAIRDWILKSNDQDQVDSFIDACAQRPPAVDAELVWDKADRKSVRLIFGENEFIIVYSIFPHSPLIKIDYIKYDQRENYWCNTVDIGTPGGLTGRYQAKTVVNGEDHYIRDITYHEQSYWNTFDGGEYSQDPIDAGTLNYHNHIIMLVGNPETGTGFGRVMPVYRKDQQGGVRILKLLWDRGFECFTATGKSQAYRPAFTGYVFLFNEGFEPAVEFAKRVIDGKGKP